MYSEFLNILNAISVVTYTLEYLIINQALSKSNIQNEITLSEPKIPFEAMKIMLNLSRTAHPV